jgi:putative flavoprotein involved in K+ transport
MPRVACVVIGAGQAGLAISRCLADQGIEHVVLERGRIGERWHSERWDSLCLLTPNWQTRLPHFSYDGPDPDGFMNSGDVVAFLNRYARSFDAPVREQTSVSRVTWRAGRFTVDTNRGAWTSDAVVVATGYCDRPAVPGWATHAAPDLHQVTASDYRRPSSLEPGGVLVVGAAATGVQLADELRRDGRTVILAVGRHTRVPRTYRGRDIMWWLDRLGVLHESVDTVFDREISQSQPSFQLVGRPDRASISLADLQDSGVVVTGRLDALDGRTASFDDSLMATTVAADAKLASLLLRIDAYAAAHGVGSGETLQGYEPLWPRFVVETPRILDLGALGVRTVLWATGYKRTYPWLDVPGVLDARGEIQHIGGATPQAGLYVLGLPFLTRRNSAFIDGVGADAVALSEQITRHLHQQAHA